MTDTTENNKSDKIGLLPIRDEMKNCYLDYAMSVIVGRALPDVRDGLKPVHRRVLFAMHMLNNYHNRPFLKSARVVGDVIGKYHPHGDSAVYNSIVRLAQDFSMRYPIVDGQGNFGSVDGDNAAAMRYTEVRMQKLAEELLKDIDKDTVDWQPNYDDSLSEPMVLPTRVPNLLINGSTGIAVGMATNIPPHNLTEIVTGLIELVKNPEISNVDLMDIIPAPDFPTGGIIYGTSGVKQAYLTGKGVIQIRSKAEIEIHGKNDRERIIVTEIPYQVNKARLIEKIAYLVNHKEIDGISDINDESNRLGIRVVIDIKRGASAAVTLNKLFKQTQLQVSFGIIFLSIKNGQPRVMNLKEQLECFVDHRREIVVRRTRFELKKAKEKAHILEGLKIAVENIDEIIILIKQSAGPEIARDQLISKYELSRIQAQAILDMRLQRLTGLERDKIIEDYKNIIDEIGRLETILADSSRVMSIVQTELEEILENYSDERKTTIEGNADEIHFEDLIKDEEVIVTTTYKGYVKRMALDTYKTQKRGGKGVKGAGDSMADEDFYTNIFTAQTHDRMMFFTDKGVVFSLKVYQVPEAARTAKGRNIINLIQLPKDHNVKEIITISKDEEAKGKFLLISTKKGLVKKTSLEEYDRINQNGKIAIKINDDDEVISVRVVSEGDSILLCSTSGKSIRFMESDCRAMGRTSQGVKGISLSKTESVIGMMIVDEKTDILSVTSKGFGKRTPANDYKTQTRGGKGIIAMKLTEKNGDIVAVKPVENSDDLLLVTNAGQVIRTSVEGISVVGRNTQGVRLIRVNDDELVVAVEKIIS
jgi:DNA gyrase subunit A